MTTAVQSIAEQVKALPEGELDVSSVPRASRPAQPPGGRRGWVASDVVDGVEVALVARIYRR